MPQNSPPRNCSERSSNLNTCMVIGIGICYACVCVLCVCRSIEHVINYHQPGSSGHSLERLQQSSTYNLPRKKSSGLSFIVRPVTY